MTERETRRVTVYEPVQLITAEHGWKAVFIGEPGSPAPGYSAEPLIGWGVFRVTERPAGSGTGPTHFLGIQVHGLVALEDTVAPAPAAAANFWRYLPPGDALEPDYVTQIQHAWFTPGKAS